MLILDSHFFRPRVHQYFSKQHQCGRFRWSQKRCHRCWGCDAAACFEGWSKGDSPCVQYSTSDQKRKHCTLIREGLTPLRLIVNHDFAWSRNSLVSALSGGRLMGSCYTSFTSVLLCLRWTKRWRPDGAIVFAHSCSSSPFFFLSRGHLLPCTNLTAFAIDKTALGWRCCRRAFECQETCLVEAEARRKQRTLDHRLVGWETTFINVQAKKKRPVAGPYRSSQWRANVSLPAISTVAKTKNRWNSLMGGVRLLLLRWTHLGWCCVHEKHAQFKSLWKVEYRHFPFIELANSIMLSGR